ncbi:MAG: hypothetical protein ACRD0R_19745 [Acidimicrobiales bacterium]
MDIRLIRRPHTNPMVRVSGIEPTDPYLEWCWLHVVGPSTVALVRHVGDLTAPSGEARIPLSGLGRLLGLGAVNMPSRNKTLVRTMGRAEQFGLAFTHVGVPDESLTFGIHGQLALVPTRLLERLPDVARQRHVAAVEVANEALTAAGLPALRSGRPAGLRARERPQTVPRTSPPDTAAAPVRRPVHAVPPIARLDANVAATAPPPELSL